MNKIILLAAVLLMNYTGFSQKEAKLTNYYYNVKFGEQYGVFISANNVVSKFNFAKLKLVINNKTDNYLLIKKDKSKFVFNKNSYFPKVVKKAKILKPNKNTFFTLQVAKETNYLVEYFSLQPKGIFTFSTDGKVTKVEDFHLPPNKNTITAGSFKINMKKLKKETQKTSIRFEFTYTGDKIGVVTPANCVLKTKSGKEWANAKSKDKTIILQKNESKSYTFHFEIPAKQDVDMQFVEMDLVWKGAFKEADLKELNFDIQTVRLKKSK